MSKEKDIADCTLLAEKLLGWEVEDGRCILPGTGYLSSVILEAVRKLKKDKQ